MRISHVITRLIVGGAQENTLASVLGLRQKPGLEVELVSGPTRGSEGSLDPVALSLGQDYVLSPHLVRPVHPWHDLLAARDLVRHFRATGPDIVHTHSGKAGVLGRLAAHRARVPVIIHTIHGPSFGPFQGALANAVFRQAELQAARVTTRFVVVAHAMRDQYLRAGIGDPARFERIFSGFDLDPFLQATRDPALMQRLGLPADGFVIGKLARLFELKGHAELLDAATLLLGECPRAHLLLVGDGPLRPSLEALCRRPPLAGRVHFAGLVPPADVPRYLACMDVLVHLSHREGLPRALPQALAAGIPVVSTDNDGAPEVCIPDHTGFLVAQGDTDGLIQALKRLEADPGLRQRLGETGRARVSAQFSTRTMVDALESLYRREVPVSRP
jgi:glycosyltransferase involved in cell wall biosynthesis